MNVELENFKNLFTKLKNKKLEFIEDGELIKLEELNKIAIESLKDNTYSLKDIYEISLLKFQVFYFLLKTIIKVNIQIMSYDFIVIKNKFLSMIKY